MKLRSISLTPLLAIALAIAVTVFSTESHAQDDAAKQKVFRVGMIGLDTSHAKAFTTILNDPENGYAVKVVAAVPQSSPDIESSVSRIDGYVELLKTEFGVKMYDTIEEMLPHVDGVLIESVDGRPHLAQATPCIIAGKPTFIDKPAAATLKDVIAIYDLAKKHGTPVWSSSNLRFHSGVVAAANADVGEQTMVFSFGPASLEEHHMDLAWYAIHPVEALFTVMGTGCKTVSRVHTEGTDVVTGLWDDDRIGVMMGIRKGKNQYGLKVFGTKGSVEEKAGGAYPEIMAAMVKFFETGEPPVSPETTIEIFAYIEAADESKRQDGAPVSIADTIAKHSK